MNIGLALKRAGRTKIGRSLKIGFGESIGYQYEGKNLVQNIFGSNVKSQGFLGLKAQAGTYSEGMRNLIKGPNRGLGRVFGGVLGLGFTASMMYSGYKNEGAWGAMKGVAESTLWSAAPRVLGSLMHPAIPVVAGVAALGYGAYQLGEAGIKHHERIRDTEMAAVPPDVLQNYGVATMRQRSVMALQNTHINGRMALGNEGKLFHTPFRL